jgi:protoheme IX farnesyltransferase
MRPGAETVTLELTRARQRAADFAALTKPRVVLMVLLTAVTGFYLGSRGVPDYRALVHMLIGMALAAAGSLTLNQFLERDLDARMDRTRLRPLPDGRVEPTEALVFGAAVTAAGVLYLGLLVNALSGMVAAIVVITYLFLYTPLKTKTPLCSVVGAVPGALPPVIGWAAARGELHLETWVLFSILYLWQLPHTLAIGTLYREDYARAGILVLPVVDPDGRSTARHVVSNCFALLVVGLLPTLIGLTGSLYFLGALGLGLALVGCGVSLAVSRSPAAARRLFFASLIYLPALLGLMVFDKAPF